MTRPDDLHRYIEYLQRGVLTPEWEGVYDASRLKEWMLKNSARLSAVGNSDQWTDQESPVKHLEALVGQFQPKTKFELPYTSAIFSPLFEQVRLAAANLGLKPIRDVNIATSTEIAATPLARPSEGPHILLIGLGTSSFCNYWAKALTFVIKGLARTDPTRVVQSIEDLKVVFAHDPSGLVLAVKLTLYYASSGSLIGFGEVNQPASYLTYRLQLLRAMELFAVAHEYSHFVAEERLPQFRGILDEAQSHGLELFCDELALAISRECGNQQNNQLMFSGIGGLVFFRAIQLCEAAREEVRRYFQESAINAGSVQKPPRNQFVLARTHPPLEDRIAAIKQKTIERTCDDQRAGVSEFINEYDRLVGGLASAILSAFSELRSSERS